MFINWAVHNSSIGDLVTESLTHLLFLTLKSDPRDQWPLRHLITVMKKHDLTNILTMLNFFDNLWQFLTISDNFWQFLTILTIFVKLIKNCWPQPIWYVCNSLSYFTVHICWALSCDVKIFTGGITSPELKIFFGKWYVTPWGWS